MGPKRGRFHDDSHAADYDRRAARSDIRARLTPLLVEALAAARPVRLLDLAAGTGRFTYPVAAALPGASVVALDEAPAMLKVAQERRAEERAGNVALVCGSAEALPFRRDVFDRVFTAFALHHFPKAPAVLEEAARVMRHGGKILVLDPLLPEPEDDLDRRVNRTINEILARATAGSFVHRTASEIERLLAGAGFRDPRTQVRRFSVDQDGFDGIPTGRHWLQIAEGMSREPKEVRERFEERYFRREARGDAVRVSGAFLFGLVAASFESDRKG